jgi:hypothetical protein
MAVCLVTTAPDASATGPRVEELEVVTSTRWATRSNASCAPAACRSARCPAYCVRPGRPRGVKAPSRCACARTASDPGVDVVTGNFVRLPERRRAARIG